MKIQLNKNLQAIDEEIKQIVHNYGGMLLFSEYELSNTFSLLNSYLI